MTLAVALVLIGLCVAIIACVLALGRLDRKAEEARYMRLLSDRDRPETDWERVGALARARRERALRRESIQLEPTPLGKTRVGVDKRAARSQERRAA